jgi:bacterial/archaeal transporter family-2 protein
MEALAIPFLLVVGGLLALQAAANVQLSAAMGSPFGASTLQLGLGAGLLLALAALGGSLEAFALLGDAEPWALAGGLGSAIYITAGILLFPRLGAMVTVGLFVAGQMAASLALDAFGWLGVAQQTPGTAAFVGAAAVVAGTGLIVRVQAGADAIGVAARRRTGWLVLGLTAGAVLPVQGAVNAELNGELDSAIVVGAMSFLVATAAMTVALAGILALGAPRPQLMPLSRVPWWGWLGGACGATYVTSVFLMLPEIGAAPVVVLTVAGQQLASVLVDRFGLLRLQRRRISRPRLAAVGVLLAGVGLITLG